jgi:predicted peroxiredoxin
MTDTARRREPAADERMGGMTRKLVVKTTAGADAPERCAQAFTVAAVAVASGVDVSLWLTGESAWLALPGRAERFELAKSPPLQDLRDAVLARGQITLCTQCAARRGIEQADVIPGVRIAGAQAFVEEVMADDVRALIY